MYRPQNGYRVGSEVLESLPSKEGVEDNLRKGN